MTDKTDLERNREDMLVKAKGEALRLITFQPRSVEELRSRLKLKKYPEDIAEDVIVAFKKQGLLDDEKFAKFFANSKIYSRPAGKKLLALELKKKGLAGTLIAETIDKLEDYDEKKIALDLASKRADRMTGVSIEKKKARLFGFLQRRGFSSEVVYSVLNDLFKG